MTHGHHWLSWLRRMNEGGVGRLIGWRGRRAIEKGALQLAGFSVQQPVLTLRPDRPAASLFAVGDIGLHSLDEGRQRWRAELLAMARAETERTDLLIGNLEAQLTRRKPAYRGGLSASPCWVESLAGVGFDAVTCANNHALDCGDEGLADSIAALDSAGIKCCGAGLSVHQARSPVVMNARGVSVGMLGYADDTHDAADAPGRACVAAAEEPAMLEDIGRLRGRVDIVVVQAHWGYEWVVHPLLFHRDLARRCIDAGADLVLCHHAHVPMAVEAWGRGIIAHGLGSLVFGWKGAARHPWRNVSLGLRIELSRAGVHSACVVPFRETAAGVQICSPWRRRQVLGALWLLGRTLQDDGYLAGLQRQRAADEGASRAAACLRAQRANDQREGALLARHLRAPRQRLLYRWLGETGTPESALVSSYLKHVADAAPGVLPSRLPAGSGPRADAVLQAVDTLRARHGARSGEWGRLP